MSDEELLQFGREMRRLAYPLTDDHRGEPSVTVFSIQLDEARAEWRRPKTRCARWRGVRQGTSGSVPRRSHQQWWPPAQPDAVPGAATLLVPAGVSAAICNRGAEPLRPA